MDVRGAFCTVPGTQQACTQHIWLVFLVRPVATLNPRHLLQPRSEWELFGTRAPSGGCSLHSHPGPSRKVWGCWVGGHQAPLPFPHRERGREVGRRKCLTSLTIFFTSFLTLVKLGPVGLGVGGGLEGRASGCMILGDWSLPPPHLPPSPPREVLTHGLPDRPQDGRNAAR